MDPKYPHIDAQLTGEDGNAFALVGKVAREMRRHKLDKDQIDAFIHEAMSGDYDHLLRTCTEWVTVK